MTLTQAEMEAKYDAERSGSAYVKPHLVGAVLSYIAQVEADDENAIADEIDRILEECDGGERRAIDERFERVIDAVAELPDKSQSAISMWEGFLAGVAIGNALK